MPNGHALNYGKGRSLHGSISNRTLRCDGYSSELDRVACREHKQETNDRKQPLTAFLAVIYHMHQLR
jgi:hypothetical protein